MPRQNKPWKDLYDGIPVIRDPKRQYVPPVTEADLDQVEVDLGFHFPESYRAFMLQFGPGSLVGYWLLPLIPKQTRPPGTITEITRKYREASQKYLDEIPKGTWNLGVICFADYGPHTLAWHADGKISKAGEPCIYDLCSEEEQEPLVVADCFWRFVEYVEKGSWHPLNAFRHGEGGLYFMPGTLVGGKHRS